MRWISSLAEIIRVQVDYINYYQNFNILTLIPCGTHRAYHSIYENSGRTYNMVPRASAKIVPSVKVGKIYSIKPGIFLGNRVKNYLFGKKKVSKIA